MTGSPDDSFSLGITHPGWGGGRGRVGVLEGRGKRSRERGKKVKSVGMEKVVVTVGDELAGQTPGQPSPRERNVPQLKVMFYCTVGNRQKNGQHSETVGLDNPQLGCLTPKGQMSANSPRVLKHLWFLLDMSELVSLIVGTFPLSHLLSVLYVPMR